MIKDVDTNSHTIWQTVKIQISWLLKKPTDLDLHWLQRQGIYGTSRPRVDFPGETWHNFLVFLKKKKKKKKGRCYLNKISMHRIYVKYSDK